LYISNSKPCLKKPVLSHQAVGEKFDHYRHEAMMQTLTGDQEEDTYSKNLQKGIC